MARLDQGSHHRPEHFVPFDLLEALSGRQPAVHGEPALGMTKIREVEATESVQRHPGSPDEEIVFGAPAGCTVRCADVERLAAPDHDTSGKTTTRGRLRFGARRPRRHRPAPRRAGQIRPSASARDVRSAFDRVLTDLNSRTRLASCCAGFNETFDFSSMNPLRFIASYSRRTLTIVAPILREDLECR